MCSSQGSGTEKKPTKISAFSLLLQMFWEKNIFDSLKWKTFALLMKLLPFTKPEHSSKLQSQQDCSSAQFPSTTRTGHAHKSRHGQSNPGSVCIKVFNVNKPDKCAQPPPFAEGDEAGVERHRCRSCSARLYRSWFPLNCAPRLTSLPMATEGRLSGFQRDAAD